jgi:prepilin-type N-terminal cleavage/methylation domain-containing protein
MKKLTNQKGFTIVELMIASTILTTILVAASFVLVQIGRLYYKGVITSRTQDTARNLVESISRPSQLEGSNISPPVTNNLSGWTVRCVGNQRFSYILNAVAVDGNPVALKDTVASLDECGQPAIAGGAGVESLLANNMRISELDIIENASTGMREISVVVLYGENDDFIPADINATPSRPLPTCKQQESSAQWCAVAAYSTRVFPRVGQ